MKVTILDDVAVSRPGPVEGAGSVCAFPSACRLPGGRILCSYRQGREKHSRDGVLRTQWSDDEGITWSAPVTIFDAMGGVQPRSVHSGVLSASATGTAQAFFTYVEAEKPGAYIFSEAGRQLKQILVLSQSHDRGGSWGPSFPCDLQLDRRTRNVYTGARSLTTTSGELLLPLEATGENGLQFIIHTRSRDEGRTLKAAESLFDPAGKVNYGDPRLTRTPSGRLLMLAWAFTQEPERTLPVRMSLSMDDGSTWQSPLSTGIMAQVTSPMALDDRRIVAAGNVRSGRAGIYLWESEDGSKSWVTGSRVRLWDCDREQVTGEPESGEQMANSAAVWDELPRFTFGTPELLLLDSSRLLLTYYATIQGRTHVRACRFAVE